MALNYITMRSNASAGQKKVDIAGSMTLREEPMSQCIVKHTKFQPSLDEWLCPRCSADSNAFYIDDSPFDAKDDCSRLHDDDFVVCINCKRDFTGKSVAKAIIQKQNMVVCQHCSGRGYVQKGEPDEKIPI